MIISVASMRAHCIACTNERWWQTTTESNKNTLQLNCRYNEIVFDWPFCNKSKTKMNKKNFIVIHASHFDIYDLNRQRTIISIKELFFVCVYSSFCFALLSDSCIDDSMCSAIHCAYNANELKWWNSFDAHLDAPKRWRI